MNWETLGIAIIIVVGLIEYLKGFKAAKEKLGSAVWHALLLPISLTVALTIEFLPPFALFALLILAASQLGYEIAVETLQKRLGGDK